MASVDFINIAHVKWSSFYLKKSGLRLEMVAFLKEDLSVLLAQAVFPLKTRQFYLYGN